MLSSYFYLSLDLVASFQSLNLAEFRETAPLMKGLVSDHDELWGCCADGGGTKIWFYQG